MGSSRGVVFFILIFNNLHFQIIASTKKIRSEQNQKTKYKKPIIEYKTKKTQKNANRKKIGEPIL